MTRTLSQQYEICCDAIRIAIVDALTERAEYIARIERTARGDLPITGIALELFPWQGSLGLSLRETSDFPIGDSRYDSADWQHFDFTEDCQSPSIATAISIVTEIYEQGNELGNDLQDMAHLTFLAGAEALLHPDVSHLLNEYGVNAPKLTNRFESSPFQYIVVDADASLGSNYCDIVLANRIAERLLGNGA